MARKPAPRPARRGPSPAKRVEQALGERRYADALKLAKQLDRDQPSAAHRGLLRTAYLRAAEDLARRDAFRDGHALLSEAEQLSADDPEWWASLAVLRAEFGDWRRAFELLERAPDARARVEAALADRALREPAPRPELLPPELRPAHDLVRAAFAHYEAGRDDAMLQALQGVGLRSPFLDWKLLLRGLSAYSRREDERAVENWQRLDPHRLPARLAAPLRLAIDPGFREAQPAEALRALQARLDRLLPAGDLLAGLRAIDRELHRERGLAEAFRAAERLTRPLRREHPALLRRLADCLYWAITRQGRPEDMGRFLRAFGPPEHDPHFYRLQGIVLEAIGDLDQANKAWNDYQRWIAATPAQWPKPQADLARAMVWYRMGRNAQAHLRADFDEEEDVLDFLFGAPRRRPQVRPLKPTAEACFEKAAELAPDWPDPAIELMRDHLDAGRTAKAA
ncbi:MAG TPA: hypothetical protein VIL46_06715, partial [Gemmataceae bacterium]